ncbi:MAG: LacI family DNA-binding transcriptional regulator [Opitutaceae bacterium]|nr:LacI family DNA-binding transcriptional regulator [Opitutaceae bacterium]
MTSELPQGPIASTTALARHLGLSRWTISRVLNGHPEVKPETSRRVREAMIQLGFVPSPVGRALRGGRTGMVGVCFQALGSPIVARKIASLQRTLRGAGFRALFELTDGRPEIELEVVRHFVAMKLDGLVLVGGMTTENEAAILAMLAQHRMSAVLIDPARELALPTVELDREHGIRLAFEHLLELGHTRFALLGIDEDVAYGRARLEGIRKLARSRRLSFDKHLVTLTEKSPGSLDFAYGRRLAERYLTLADRPRAILALNDQVAIGAMTRLQQAGLSVPGDVSLVGFDNLEVAGHVNPRLTTIDQHVDELMTHAVELLTRQTAPAGSEESEPRRVVRPALIVGESTGRAT